GDDGILGDDGRIYTSRNTSDPTKVETLNNVTVPFLATDPNPKPSDIDGNVLNEVIATPGIMQLATINVGGQLKKAADLTHFSVDTTFNALNDEKAFKATNDDIIFGGLGNDTVHGGSGDDAIGGGEALDGVTTRSYTQTEDPTTLVLTGIAETDYAHPYN